MSAQTNAKVFAKIEEETKNSLSGDKLRNALDFISYLKESGRMWIFEKDECHPEFYYMDELTCLISYSKFDGDETTLSAVYQDDKRAYVVQKRADNRRDNTGSRKEYHNYAHRKSQNNVLIYYAFCVPGEFYGVRDIGEIIVHQGNIRALNSRV